MICTICYEESDLDEQLDIRALKLMLVEQPVVDDHSLLVDQAVEEFICCNGHQMHTSCISRWTAVRLQKKRPLGGETMPKSRTEISCPLCRREYSQREHEAILSYANTIEAILTRMDRCNDILLRHIMAVGINCPLDFFTSSVVYAISEDNLDHLAILKEIESRQSHFKLNAKLRITAAVYQCTHSSRFNWVFNEFGELSNFQATGAASVMAECLQRMENGAAFNLYVVGFFDLCQEERIEYGYELVKLSASPDISLRNNYVALPSLAFSVIWERYKFTFELCDSIRTVFLPILCSYMTQRSKKCLDSMTFVIFCILNTNHCKCKDHFWAFFVPLLQSGNTAVLKHFLGEYLERSLSETRVIEDSFFSVPKLVTSSPNAEAFSEILMAHGRPRSPWLWKRVYLFFRRRHRISTSNQIM